jgi:hypothetical protein
MRRRGSDLLYSGRHGGAVQKRGVEGTVCTPLAGPCLGPAQHRDHGPHRDQGPVDALFIFYRTTILSLPTYRRTKSTDKVGK